MTNDNQRIKFRIKRIVKQGINRAIFIPKLYLPDFDEMQGYDVICIPRPEEEGDEK